MPLVAAIFFVLFVVLSFVLLAHSDRFRSAPLAAPLSAPNSFAVHCVISD
nr:MAG TPA: hypothetical protein [Bacteriophage sp.]